MLIYEDSIAFAVIYWYVWTVLLPRWGGYKLVETVDTLDDGTGVTKLARSYDIDIHGSLSR